MAKKQEKGEGKGGKKAHLGKNPTFGKAVGQFEVWGILKTRRGSHRITVSGTSMEDEKRLRRSSQA